MKAILLFFIAISYLGAFVYGFSGSVLNEFSIFEKIKIPENAQALFQEPVSEGRKRSNSFPTDFGSQLSNYINNVIMPCQKWQIPGLAITVVTGNQVLFQKGFGVTDFVSQKAVDPYTLFGIGSCTKAFTSTATAMLVDAGLINYDEPIIGRAMPSFRMKDDYVTAAVTPRDMMSHRTGLPRHDFIWAAGPNITRNDLLNTLQYLDSNLEFRTVFEYNNLMWASMGFIGANLAQTTWENAMQQLIFTPLGMSETTTSVETAIKSGNYAFPYGISEATNKAAPYPKDINKIIDLVAPAGAISSNVKDLSNWLQFHLNHGVWNGQQLVSLLNLAETYKPSMHLPQYFTLQQPIFPASMTSAAYGMGWMPGSYRGHPLLQHGGNTIGHSALNIFFPGDNIGISILTNMNGLGLPHLEIAWFAFDLLLGYQTWLNGNNSCNFPCTFVKCEEKQEQKEEEEKFTESSIDPSQYVGIYYQPTYGQIKISMEGNNLTLSFWLLTGTLTPRGKTPDTFTLTSTTFPLSLDPFTLPIQFARNFDGSVDSILMPLEPTLPPIVFINQKYSSKTCAFKTSPNPSKEELSMAKKNIKKEMIHIQ